MTLLHRSCMLVLAASFAAVSQALTIVKLDLGVNSNRALVLTKTPTAQQVWSGDLVNSLDGPNPSRHFYCLTPNVNLVRPAWYRKTIVKQYQGKSLGSLMGALAASTNQATGSGRQLALWQTLGGVTFAADSNFDAANAVAAAGIAAFNVAVASSGFTAAEFFLYEPIKTNSSGQWLDQAGNITTDPGKIVVDLQNQAMISSEAVPEPMTLALGAAGLAAAVRRRRRRG